MNDVDQLKSRPKAAAPRLPIHGDVEGSQRTPIPTNLRTALVAVRCVVRPADPGWRPSPGAELAHLRLCWGRLYEIGYHAGSPQWVARFLGSSEQMIAGSPLELRRMIRDDWIVRQPGPGWVAGGEGDDDDC